MTSLIAWIGVDHRGPASVYIASDSRLSTSRIKWDFGRKVFACNSSPNIFGYCGAVLFPSQFLGQLTAAIDAGWLFRATTTPEEKLQIVAKHISDAARRFPEQAPFTIVYATRTGEGFGASFRVSTISWETRAITTTKTYSVPQTSDLLFAYGSGKPVIEEFSFNWRRSDIGRTSRAVFSAFCDAIASGADEYSGGAPQLAGIYLRGSARPFGIFYRGSCYLHGFRADVTSDTIECRNELFERCDVIGTLNGKRQPRPLNSQPNKASG